MSDYTDAQDEQDAQEEKTAKAEAKTARAKAAEQAKQDAIPKPIHVAVGADLPTLEAAKLEIEARIRVEQAKRAYVEYPRWVKKTLVPAKEATATAVAIPAVIEGPVQVESADALAKLGPGWE